MRRWSAAMSKGLDRFAAFAAQQAQTAARQQAEGPIPAAQPPAPQPPRSAPVSRAEPPSFASVLNDNKSGAAVIADLLRWAVSYYPQRAEPPPDIMALRLTDAEIGELFTKAPSRLAHLALVDQPAIRNRLGDPELAALVKAAWAQKSGS
jgi:hypothetical protein